MIFLLCLIVYFLIGFILGFVCIWKAFISEENPSLFIFIMTIMWPFAIFFTICVAFDNFIISRRNK